MLHHKSDPWGTLREDHTSRLPHLGFFSSHLTAITSENLFSSFFSFTFIPKILLSFISSQLTTWFCHNSQKTSMPPVHPCMFYERVIAFVNLTIVTMISKALNLHNGICMMEEVVPTDTWVHNSIFWLSDLEWKLYLIVKWVSWLLMSIVYDYVWLYSFRD